MPHLLQVRASNPPDVSRLLAAGIALFAPICSTAHDVPSPPGREPPRRPTDSSSFEAEPPWLAGRENSGFEVDRRCEASSFSATSRCHPSSCFLPPRAHARHGRDKLKWSPRIGYAHTPRRSPDITRLRRPPREQAPAPRREPQADGTKRSTAPAGRGAGQNRTVRAGSGCPRRTPCAALCCVSACRL